MKLIVGLGNIGTHFEGTRHNTGFMLCDALAAQFSAEWQQKDKFKAFCAEFTHNSEKVLMIKPSTYYNLSGEAVRVVKDFYKLQNQDILVIHDELALPFGTVRVRLSGSDAGNNGIKSVVTHLGADIARIRVGIANEHIAQHDAADFVLSPFSHEERESLPQIVDVVVAIAQDFIQNKKLEHQSVRVG